MFDYIEFHNTRGDVQLAVYDEAGWLVGFVRDQEGSSWFPTREAALRALSTTTAPIH